jgi:hypothetical protein
MGPYFKQESERNPHRDCKFLMGRGPLATPMRRDIPKRVRRFGFGKFRGQANIRQFAIVQRAQPLTAARQGSPKAQRLAESDVNRGGSLGKCTCGHGIFLPHFAMLEAGSSFLLMFYPSRDHHRNEWL